MKVFGYGTFITNSIYQKFSDVRSAFLAGYIRVQRPIDPFPYILLNHSQDMSKGIWGLVFKVESEGLENLDYYEGSLYCRIQETVLYSDKSTDKVLVYYPTERTISHYQLYDYVSQEDPWRMKIIAQHPDILLQYPELARSSFSE